MSFSNEQLGDVIKKNPISVGCGILSLILLVTAYYRADLAAEAKVELDQRSAEAARLAANLKNSAQLKEHFESIVASQKQIEGRLIQPKQLTANSQYFYKLESDAGVKMLDLRQSSSTTGKKAGKGPFLPTMFTVSVQGDYTHLLNYLRSLENGAHYCRILTASCSNSGTERGAILTVVLSLELLGFP